MIRRPPRSTLFPSTTPSRSLLRLPARRRRLQPMTLSPIERRPRRRRRGLGRGAAWLAGLALAVILFGVGVAVGEALDRKSTRLNSSHSQNSDAAFGLKTKHH